jgi:hypothetical protein
MKMGLLTAAIEFARPVKGGIRLCKEMIIVLHKFLVRAQLSVAYFAVTLDWSLGRPRQYGRFAEQNDVCRQPDPLSAREFSARTDKTVFWRKARPTLSIRIRT